MDKIATDLQYLSAQALELGASKAKVVEVKGIKTGAWTRMKCQYGCPNYGLTLCCPPYAPDYTAMQAFLAEYTWGLLVEYSFPLTESDCQNFTAADLQMSNKLLEILLALEREAFLRNYYRSFALKAGRCRLCEKCNLVKCVHPAQARPSMEACGIDVFALANDNGFPMQVIQGPVVELKVYGLVLVE